MIKLKNLIGEEKQPLKESSDELADMVGQAEKLGKQFKGFAHEISRDLDSRDNRLVGKALKDYNTFFNSFKAMWKRIA
tara:strand:+ start:305 stop:538 length:234 start_codon:yes stop_codon:yes gene_type:complete